MQKHKFKFFRGDDVSYRLLFALPSGEPVNLTAARLDLHVVAEDELKIALSTENGGIETHENGEVILHFSHADTQAANWENANYDLQITDSLGKRKTVLYGTINLIPDHTRIQRRQVLDDIVITVQPTETINVVIERLEVIHIEEDDCDMSDLLSIYQQAKEL